VSQQGDDGFHKKPYALRSGKPATGARALPDGEIIAGTPIPAVVPLPGKAMAPMPGKVAVVPKIGQTLVAAGDDDDDGDDDHGGGNGGVQAIGSLALVDRSEANRNADGSLKNPGFPFWIGGMESSVGQRPPTPPLDMLDAAKAQALKTSGNGLWANLDPNQSGGWDGGLGRHALDGVSAGGEAHTVTTSLDFSPSRFTCRKRAPKSNRRPWPSTPRRSTQALPCCRANRWWRATSAPTVPCRLPVRRSTNRAWMIGPNA
jgi:hypothetical protein